jgi:Galactose-3-O-sulfotransferase
MTVEALGPEPDRTAPESAQPLVVFVHVRKTAGKSLRQLLYRQYPRRGALLVKNYFTQAEVAEAYVRELAASPPDGLRVAHGHMLFWPEFSWPEGTQFFTMLRDPLERTISHYYWLRARTTKFQKPLGEAVSDGSIHDNLQTRVLSASMPPFGELAEQSLELAIQRLEDFAVVGLTERFDESVVLLTRTLGWRRMVYTRENVTPNRKPLSEISEEEIEVIRKHNALDLALYAEARRMFKKQVQAQDGAFAIEVEALKRAVKRAATLAESTTPRPLPSRIGTEGQQDFDPLDLLIEAQADLLVRDLELERTPQPSVPLRPPRVDLQTLEERLGKLTNAVSEARGRLRRLEAELRTAGEDVFTEPAKLAALRKDIEVTRERLGKFSARVAQVERELAARKTQAELGAG